MVGRQYKIFTDMGIKGVWNDMNEPSIFYTPTRVQKLFESLEKAKVEENELGQKLSLIQKLSKIFKQ